MKKTSNEIATLAGGCFWCTEAVFQRVKGVIKVTSGYTGHAEAIRIEYNPAEISYEEILDIFWKVHDPTTLNQQGSDVGPQYRSAIFYSSPEQKEVAEKSKSEAQKNFAAPIVTEVVEAGKFYPAEDYHQDFYNQNRDYPYCRIVIDPKVQKLQQIRDPKGIKEL